MYLKWWFWKINPTTYVVVEESKTFGFVEAWHTMNDSINRDFCKLLRCWPKESCSSIFIWNTIIGSDHSRIHTLGPIPCWPYMWHEKVGTTIWAIWSMGWGARKRIHLLPEVAFLTPRPVNGRNQNRNLRPFFFRTSMPFLDFLGVSYGVGRNPFTPSTPVFAGVAGKKKLWKPFHLFQLFHRRTKVVLIVVLRIAYFPKFFDKMQVI